MRQKITEKEAEKILEKLDELEETIDDIARNVRVMMQIHEMLHPEELERARRKVERETSSK